MGMTRPAYLSLAVIAFLSLASPILWSCDGGGGTEPEPALVATVAVSPPVGSVSVGETLQLTATPMDAAGNPLAGRAVSWSSDDISVVTVDGNGLVTGVGAGTTAVVATSEGKRGSAALTVPAYTLTVAKAGTGTGAVTSTPAGIDCGEDCTADFASGIVVTLMATPAAGSLFVGWSGACSGSDASCQVTMDAPYPVAATFQLLHTLTVTKAGTGSGTVTTTPEGIACGSQCSASFGAGSLVTLTASAAIGSVFTGWSGACSGTDPACQVIMNAAQDVTATFDEREYTLTVTQEGTGSGRVSSSPDGIDCGAQCSASFGAGVAVTLTATPAIGSVFEGWNGACTGTDASCQVTMDGARAVTATFVPLTYPLTVIAAGTGSGTVESDPAGIDCGGACSASFGAGVVVTLTGTPAEGSVWAGWSGACSGMEEECQVTMDAAKEATATFNVLGLGFGDEQFALIPAGTFQMGDMMGTGFVDELPVHSVTITHAFYMQRTEITQSQWREVMGTDPSQFGSCGDVCPVERVSWNDIQAFLAALNDMDPGKNYRLPTEAEWEYACRAGTTGDYGGNGVLDDMGWYVENSAIGSQLQTHPVARKLANTWGLFDMHGNVAEWVQDWYAWDYYSASPMADPGGPGTGTSRVLRGGSWRFNAYIARSAARAHDNPSFRYDVYGFRLVREK